VEEEIRRESGGQSEVWHEKKDEFHYDTLDGHRRQNKQGRLRRRSWSPGGTAPGFGLRYGDAVKKEEGKRAEWGLIPKGDPKRAVLAKKKKKTAYLYRGLPYERNAGRFRCILLKRTCEKLRREETCLQGLA